MANMTATTYDAPMTQSRYVSTNLTPNAYAAVRRLGLELSVSADRRVTMSETVAALVELAQLHRDELTDLITRPKQEGSTDD